MKCRPGCLPLNLERFVLTANILFKKDKTTSKVSGNTDKIQALGLYLVEERRLIQKKDALVGAYAKSEYKF